MKIESDLLIRLSKIQVDFWEKRDRFRKYFNDESLIRSILLSLLAHTCETYREFFHVPSNDINRKKFPGQSLFKNSDAAADILKEYQEVRSCRGGTYRLTLRSARKFRI